MRKIFVAFLVMLCALPLNAHAVTYIDNPEPLYKEFSGKSGAAPVQNKYHYPAITWGDSILAVSNESLFPGGVKLVDSPSQQVKDVLAGKTPFVRQTVGSGVMVLNALSNAGVKMELFHTVTDSYGGDVIVSRGIKNIDDLKVKLDAGERVVFAIQYGGPQMGWLVELLTSIGHSMNDSNVVIKYLPELSGDNSPEEAIAVDKTIDLAFVIGPSAANLTIGENAVPGLKALTSTKVMAQAIKDVIFVRSDWAKSHKAQLKKIRSAFIQANKKLLDTSMVKKAAVLMFGDTDDQSIADTKGLRDDARFHTLDMSNNFMFAPTNLNNFPRKVISIVSEFSKVGLISTSNFGIPVTDWGVAVSNTARVTDVSKATQVEIEKQVSQLNDAGQGEVVVSSKIFFQPNQGQFTESVYGEEFLKAIQNKAKYSGAVFNIVGHVDPSLLRAWNKAIEFKKAGNTAKLLKVENWLLKSTQKRWNLASMSLQLIKIERNNVQSAAAESSRIRAYAVKKALIDYSVKRGIDINAAKMVVHGDGADSPIHANPRTPQQSRENMRVELTLTNYNAEIEGFSEAQDF